MAKDLTKFSKNNELREIQAVVGKVEFTTTIGDIVSGEVNDIAYIPAGCLIKTGAVIVDTACNGTTPTFDIGTEDDTDMFVNDLDVSSTGHTAAGTGLNTLTTKLTKLSVVPTVAGDTTEGALRVIVDFIDLDCTTGSYVGGL